MSRCVRSRAVLPIADDVSVALARHFPAGHARILAALTRRFGVLNFSLVENAVQEAYARAVSRWPEHGPPDDAEGWLVRVAHNVAIDALRRERILESLDSARAIAADPPIPDSDDEIRLMFLCCDPVLPRAAQIALVLNVAFGLSARQIASAFLSDERTVAQRIVRAKQRLRDEGTHFDLPTGGALSERIGAILDVLYVVFSEGYNPSVGEEAFDPGLCRESLRFVRLLTERPDTATPTAFALRALLCFHAARATARFADDGGLLLIPEQDRTCWDPVLIDEAFLCLERAGSGTELTRFHVEAGIAACHALAPSYAGTDWERVVDLYDLLRHLSPSLVIDVNRALAIAMHGGAPVGQGVLDIITERDVV